MAILFSKTKRPSPKDGSLKYYPSVRTIGQVNQKKVAKLISDETTLNPYEAEMALNQLEKVLKQLLLSGYSVKMGDWASFHVTATSEGSDTEKECNAAKIKRVRVQCRFGKEFRDDMQNADFKLVQELVESKQKKAPSGDQGE